MIIFGTRGVKSTIKEGQFDCPQCEGQKRYRHRKVTKFFTLYFIPLIPLGSAGEYVECMTCKGTFVTKVLNYKRSTGNDQFLSEYEKAMKHTMVLMMLADGIIDDNEMLMVQKIVNKFGHNDVTLPELKDYVDEVQRNPEDVSTYLKKVTPGLNEHGKEVIVKCAYAVAASDGHVDPTEIALIHKIAEVMEMSSSHLKGILADMTEKDKKKNTFSDN